ncbi:uncharacterized protein N0V89_009681 [Didymosphaeria variabile]|uniref:3'-5' exonuclease domain-containing protein n=1 Tax=Didymosphaeria variabile TaxID=1932322 RepID=A0A9W8XDY9_9PLEO|nr:uncharacterized protein N0V89_009681 [Didymosphaeria variabile]KAJ4348307.1 hypothetical protein N0V89_009681 [Didymosphaeria variabile]
MSTARLVSNTADLAQVLGRLNVSTTVPPHLYIDLEGINLSRHGSISLLTLYDRSLPCIFLIDVHALGFAAFTTPSTTCATISRSDDNIQLIGTNNIEMNVCSDEKPCLITLKSILESPEIPKVFFDVRNDSDALFHHFGIELRGIQDLQVMELATRGGRNRERVNGLSRCIEFGLINVLTPLQRSQVKTIKARGAELFSPEKGGSYAVFNERPLDMMLEHYCMQDVVHMPALWNVYNYKLRIRFWNFVVEHETKKRLAESRAPAYLPTGMHKSLGWTWEHLRQLERAWNG